MHRLVRFFFSLIRTLSLLLFVAAIILWFRSYYLTDQITWQNTGGWRQIRTAQGHFVLGFFLDDWSDLPASREPLRYQRDEVRPPINYLLFESPDPDDTWASWDQAGFAYYHKRSVAKSRLAVIAAAPGWSIVLASAIFPLTWITTRIRARLRRRRLLRQGLCLHCGYDLRATPTGSPCPECGKPFPTNPI